MKIEASPETKLLNLTVDEANLLAPANSKQAVYLAQDADGGELATERAMLEQAIDTVDGAFADIGASYGLYTQTVAQHNGVESYAIEPDSTSVKILTLNQAFGDVNVVQAACWDKSVSLRFENDNTSIGQGTVIEDSTGTIDGRPLADICDATYVKIDVEGAEKRVLEGMDLSSVKTIWMELHANNLLQAYNTSQNEVIDLLQDAGFDVRQFAQPNPQVKNAHIQASR